MYNLLLLLLSITLLSCNPKEESVCKTPDWSATPIVDKFEPPKEPVGFNKPFDLKPEESRVQFLYVLNGSFMSAHEELGLTLPLKKEEEGTYIVQYDFSKKQYTKAWKLDEKIISTNGDIGFQRIAYSKTQDRYFILDFWGDVFKFNQYTGEITLQGNIGANRSVGNYIFWANETFYLETNGICHVTPEDGFDEKVAGSVHKIFNVNKKIQDKTDICFPEWASNRKSDGEKIYMTTASITDLYIYDPIKDQFHLETELKKEMEDKKLTFRLLENISGNKIYFGAKPEKEKYRDFYQVNLYEYDFVTKKLNVVIDKDFSPLLKYLNLDPKKAQWRPREVGVNSDNIFMTLAIGETIDFLTTSYVIIKYNVKDNSCTAIYRYSSEKSTGSLSVYGDYIYIGRIILMNMNDYSLLLTAPTEVDDEYRELPIRIK